MTCCRDCTHFIDSATYDKRRPGIAGYGYCGVAQSLEDRSRFIRGDLACWQQPIKFKPAKEAK